MTNKRRQKELMRKCFELAAFGGGSVNPNPLVGAVIVKNDKIISEGWHEVYGGPHAEVNALKRAKDDLKGADLYCNLEPCCHTKKQTPPCVPAILNSGIKNVVICNLDPNPAVSGKGVDQLRRAGVHVETGLLEKEGEYINRFYFKSVREKLPYVTIKIAQTMDAKISSEENKQNAITGKEAMEFVHSRRAVYDAVLVGADTVKVDNPRLNVRLVEGRNPLRIIIDGNLSSPLNSIVFSDDQKQNTRVITSENADPEKIRKLQDRGVKVLLAPANAKGIIAPVEILKILLDEKITSLFIEGGGKIFTQFLASGNYDDVFLLQAPIFFGRGVGAVENEKFPPLDIVNSEQIGRDLKIILKNKSNNFYLINYENLNS